MTLLPMTDTSSAEMYSLSGNFNVNITDFLVKTSNIADAGTDAKLYAALSSTTRAPVTDSNYNETYLFILWKVAIDLKGDTQTNVL